MTQCMTVAIKIVSNKEQDQTIIKLTRARPGLRTSTVTRTTINNKARTTRIDE